MLITIILRRFLANLVLFTCQAISIYKCYKVLKYNKYSILVPTPVPEEEAKKGETPQKKQDYRAHLWLVYFSGMASLSLVERYFLLEYFVIFYYELKIAFCIHLLLCPTHYEQIMHAFMERGMLPFIEKFAPYFKQTVSFLLFTLWNGYTYAFEFALDMHWIMPKHMNQFVEHTEALKQKMKTQQQQPTKTNKKKKLIKGPPRHALTGKTYNELYDQLQEEK